GEPAPLEDGGDGAEGGGDREQVAQRGLDRDGDRPEDDREQDQGEPDHDDTEGHQGGPEPVGDVDGHGGVAGDQQVVDVVGALQPLGLAADLPNQVGGRGVGLGGGRDHLHDAEVRLRVGGGERDGR